MSLLDVDRLSVGFETPDGLLVVVDDVSFSVDARETLTLVGESGSGKSVTAWSILNLVAPPGRILGGDVRFNGRSLRRLEEAAMRRVRGGDIGIVFQEPSASLSPVFPIGEQVAEVLVAHGQADWPSARREAVALLDSVRLPNAATRATAYPHELSGGQLQRVAVAMALACRPSLLIADEPTTALDVTIQAEILDLLRDLREAHGLALLLITHDLGIVAEMADRVAVMYAGRIVETAPVAELFASPAHPYTRALIASMPRGAGGRRLPAIEGNVPTPGRLPPGCAFEPRCPERIDACRAGIPPETRPGPGRTVRCIRHDGAVS